MGIYDIHTTLFLSPSAPITKWQ